MAAAKAAAAAQPGKTPGSDRVPSFEELQQDLDVQEAGDAAADRARAAGSSEEAVQQVPRHVFKSNISRLRILNATESVRCSKEMCLA